MTKFAFEVPIAHLQDFQPYQDFTFGLCFLTYTSEEYSAYLVKQINNNQTVILDNSFNETNIPISTQELVRLYRFYKPTQIISPDADWWSSDLVQAAYKELIRWVPQLSIMGVFRNYSQWAKLDYSGCKSFAIPYEFRANLIGDKVVDIKLWIEGTHYLGLGHVQQVINTHPVSLDTSIPIKMAIRGERFEDWDGVYVRKVAHETTPARLQRLWDYFHCTMTDAQLELAVHNIEVLKRSVNGE